MQKLQKSAQFQLCLTFPGQPCAVRERGFEKDRLKPLSRNAGEGAERSKAGEGLVPCSPPTVSGERGVERQQGEVRRTIGAVEAEAPAEGCGDRGEALAMTAETVGISLADAFDAADHDLVALLDTFKAHTPIERQVFLRGVDDLQQMALEPRRRKAGDCTVDRIGRRQEIADEDQLRRARQRLESREAGG